MRYYSSECPILSATDGLSYEIALTGCHFNCKGCHNKNLQDFNVGTELNRYNLGLLIDDIGFYRTRIDNIDIIGGEPLDQNHDEFLAFLQILKNRFPELGIWIYTGYEIHQVPSDILRYSDYIKCGRYIEKLRSDDGFKSEYGPTLATSNQYIIKCSDELANRGDNL